MSRTGIDERGQFVLLAGVVVALALLAMLTAYVQLGYHDDVSGGSVDRPVENGQRFLERATHRSARELRGEYDWRQRGPAVTAVRDRLRPELATLERSRLGDGVVYGTAYNQTVAAQWARANCPSGSARQFGPCEADRGVVVQERDDRTLVRAVAYDLTVTTDESETRLTIVATAVE